MHAVQYACVEGACIQIVHVLSLSTCALAAMLLHVLVCTYFVNGNKLDNRLNCVSLVTFAVSVVFMDRCTHAHVRVLLISPSLSLSLSSSSCSSRAFILMFAYYLNRWCLEGG